MVISFRGIVVVECKHLNLFANKMIFVTLRTFDIVVVLSIFVICIIRNQRYRNIEFIL